MTASKLYGNLNELYKADMLVEFINGGLTVKSVLMQDSDSRLKNELERLLSLGLNAYLSGRKYKKITIIL